MKTPNHPTRRLLVALVALALPSPVHARALVPREQREQIKDSINRAIKFLRSRQDDKGSYGNYPGVTGMVLEAFARSPKSYRSDDGPFIRRATEWLVGLQKKDGSIYDQNLPSYNTALAVLALAALGEHKAVVDKAQRFLAGLQADSGEGYTKDDKFFGGIGYGSDERPDLSNLQLSIEALKESGFAGKKTYEQAIVFLNRVQNRTESNDQPWAGNDGGFVYAPNESKAGGFQSYGSMTYAGIKSLMYCSVDKDDPRVKDGLDWLRKNWTLQTHPGMGTTGLFFYYQTLSKTLTVYGEPTFTDSRGVDHDWYAELAARLVGLQRPDGSWVNDNKKYWEGNPVLATARAVLALSYGFDRWSEHHGLK